MKIERTKVEKLTITGAPSLDPITVFAEDLGPRQGKITIECYGKSWSAYWGGCGDKGVAAFFCSCNADYIANCLERGIHATKFDPSQAEDEMKRLLLRRRRQASQWVRGDYSVDPIRNADDARAWWDRIEEEHFYDDHWANSDFFQAFLGDEWWCLLPEMPNPDYLYLCRIITAVQRAFSLQQNEVKTSAEAVPA